MSEFRARLIAGRAERLLLDSLLQRVEALGLLKRRGRQRTDSTHVLAAMRTGEPWPTETEASAEEPRAFVPVMGLRQG